MASHVFLTWFALTLSLAEIKAADGLNYHIHQKHHLLDDQQKLKVQTVLTASLQYPCLLFSSDFTESSSAKSWNYCY